jgi:hypothetical protein
MNKTVARCTLIVLGALLTGISVCAPWTLSDQNAFLRGFVNHELLSFLGVIVTITLASAANLHLELNKKEEQVGQAIFVNTRVAVKRSAYSLIAALVFGIVLVVLKPLISFGGQRQIAEALANSTSLMLLFFSASILLDLTDAAFKIGPTMPD